MKRNSSLIIAIYSHIEAYPPSLNAIYHLAKEFDMIYVLHRNVLPSKWNYPENVSLILDGKFVHADKVKQLSYLRKIQCYVSFAFRLRKLIDQHQPSMLLLYDGVAFVLGNLFAPTKLFNTTVLWYHNHDVLIQKELSKTSLMRYIRKLELRYFHRIDYFTLPSKSRLEYFPVGELTNKPIILPNFPSIHFYGKWKADGKMDGVIRLIFQGQISSSNAMEELIGLLPVSVNDKKIEVHLVGPITESYKRSLELLARDLMVREQLFIYGRLPYSELPAVTASCDVGVAFYGEHNTMVRTMSTASNKIFEYAAVGLPVIMNERSDMQKEFASYSWIKFVKFNTRQMLESIRDIVDDYDRYSDLARTDFEAMLNFESAFVPFVKSIALKK